MMGVIKIFLSRIFNTITRSVISVVDLRSSLKEVTIIEHTREYSPNFEQIHTAGSDYYWTKFKKIDLDPLFYKKIETGMIVGNGIVINADGRVILESTLFQKEYLWKLNQNHLILARAFKKKTHPKTFVLSLSNALEDNYFHWIMESLTRVLLIEPIIDLSTLTIIINDRPGHFKKDSLQFLFDISPSRITSKPASEIYKGSVIILSFTHTRNAQTLMTDIYHPFIIRELNRKAFEKFKTDPEGKFPTRFIISRRNAKDRKITNEEQFLTWLEDKTFRVMEMEALSFPDQMCLFFNAKFIISTHGAGLTNIVFCKHTTIIELFPKERNPRDGFIFTQISSELGFTHHLLPYQSSNEQQDLLIAPPLADKINVLVQEASR